MEAMVRAGAVWILILKIIFAAESFFLLFSFAKCQRHTTPQNVVCTFNTNLMSVRPGKRERERSL
jgi:hypothetical protein